MLAEGECVAFEGDACVEFDGALAVEGCAGGHGLDGGIGGFDVIDGIDELILGGGFGEDSGAMLEFVAVVEEEASVVGAEGVSGDGAGTATEGSAEVVPPGLAEVVAIGEGGAGDGSDAGVDGFEVEGLIGGWVASQLEVEVVHEATAFSEEGGAEGVGGAGEVFGEVELAEALVAGPGADGDALAGDEAHGGEAFEGGVDPTVHGDVGGADGVGSDVADVDGGGWGVRSCGGGCKGEGVGRQVDGVLAGRAERVGISGHGRGVEGVEAEVVVGAVDVATDEPASSTADDDVGGEVFVGENTADADAGGGAVDSGAGEPAGVLFADDGSHGPGGCGVVGGEGGTGGRGGEEVSVGVIDEGAVAAGDEFNDFGDG